jgi:hypothetical protein
MITDVELLVIRKAIQNLHTIGCNIGIRDKYGNEYGGFKLSPIDDAKRKRAAPVHKRGTLSQYLEPYLTLLTDVGDVIDVPMSPLFENTSRLNGAISAYMCNHYGKGTVKVEAQPEQASVRVYRIEPKKEQND